MDGLGHQNLPGGRRRLCAGGDVHDGSDCRQVLVRAPELAEIDFSRVDADPDLTAVGAEDMGEPLPPAAPALLDRARRPHGRSRVVGPPDRKIEHGP